MEQWVMLVLGSAITFFLAAINFRLGILDELKKEFKEFKDTAYKTFVSEKDCKLRKEACHK